MSSSSVQLPAQLAAVASTCTDSGSVAGSAALRGELREQTAQRLRTSLGVTSMLLPRSYAV